MGLKNEDYYNNKWTKKPSSIVKWDQQLYLAKDRVFKAIFEDRFMSDVILKYFNATKEEMLANRWVFGGNDNIEKFWKKKSWLQRFHFLLKERGIIQKGRDY